LSKKTSDSVSLPLTHTISSEYFEGEVRMSLIFVVTEEGLLMHEINIEKEKTLRVIKNVFFNPLSHLTHAGRN
jgi:hypothetical protein